MHACLFGGGYGARAAEVATALHLSPGSGSQARLRTVWHSRARDTSRRRPSAKPHVLVVDDDRAVRESLRRRLEFNGYDVSLAADGAEALAGIGGLQRQRPTPW